jgi:uncharacterized protein YxjI
MGFRERRRERREGRRERHDDRSGGTVRYRMRQRLISIGDDYWIEDDAGHRVFKVDGKAMRIRETLHFDDADGNTLLKIQERKLRVRDTMEIEDADGRTVATVRKALVSPLRHRMSVSVDDGPDLDIHGNILQHEYSIRSDGATVAEVTKRWFRIADTYGIEIAPGQNHILILAVATAVDSMAHD